jgi:hypothetical protein
MPDVSEEFLSWARNTESQNIWMRKDTESILFQKMSFPSSTICFQVRKRAVIAGPTVITGVWVCFEIYGSKRVRISEFSRLRTSWMYPDGVRKT